MSAAQPLSPPPPAGAPGSGAPARPAGRGLKRWGLRLLVAGLAGLGVAVICGLIAGFGGIGNSISALNRAPHFTGTTTLTLEDGESITLFHRQGAATPSCTVRSSSGSPTVDRGATHGRTSFGDESWETFGEFTAHGTGAHTIQCAGGGEVIAAPSGMVLTMIGGIFGLVGSVLLAIFSLLLLIAGLILWLIGRSRAKTATAAAV